MQTETGATSHYCERVGSAFWAEPANALTNAAFALAALALAYRLVRRRPAGTTWDLWLLTALIGCIAVGSFLWHTVARPWAVAADVIPIMLFVSVYLLAFLLRIAQLRLWQALLVLVAFELANVSLPALFPSVLNGSVGYLPTWLGLGLMALYCRGRLAATGRVLAVGFGVFTLSVFLRSVDAWLCSAWPIGTHLFWHLLNALVLYLAVSVLFDGPASVRYGVTKRDPGRSPTS